MKEFATAVRAVQEDEDYLEFVLVEEDEDGEAVRTVCRAYPPGDGQVAMMMAGMGRHTSNETRVAAIIDFLIGVLDEESHRYITDRLLDRRDPFGLAEINEILHWLVEEWGGRPTKSPSDFSPSRKAVGQKSTRSTSKSTSSASRRTGS